MLKYNLGTEKDTNWIVSETRFNSDNLGKVEAIFALGNGYLGIRSATEEQYLGEIRNLFVAGTFNKFDDFEVTELPNVADILQLNITLNNEKFSLEKGRLKEYRRDLNLKNGELVRRVVWENTQGHQFLLNFKRFVSLKNLHLIGQKLEIVPLNCDAEIKISSGINGQVTNSGAQHFHEGEKRIYDKKFIQLLQQTTESKIDFVINVAHSYFIDGQNVDIEQKMVIDRRKVLTEGKIFLKRDQQLNFEKISTVHTSRDRDYIGGYSLEELRHKSLDALKEDSDDGYNLLFSKSSECWNNIWSEIDIKIDSKNNFDQLAIRFAQYHLIIMTPAHDNRFGIAAKGLTGEGYKGHSFWDTEIFILPFFSYTLPDIARNLLIYRYNTIDGARNKAKNNGYEGAMYPWESAFTGDEVTPIWGAVDIVTGEATKIWSGFIEQHISSDISFAVWQYYMLTNDQDFMNNYGYEIIFETATFWQSRLEWNEDQQKYYLNNVIGPDEYKEHVNNNAFTNHTVHWNIEIAIMYYKELKESNRELWNQLNTRLKIEDSYQKWISKIDKIYLPKPGKDLVIPQDDTYLSKKIIDLTKYKNQTRVGTIFDDYNLEQVNQIQVSKQADIMVLFYLLENRFSQEVKLANWNYYEPKTLHDSSLSFSTHSVLASDMGESELAYELFQKAASIDLGSNMKSSDHGIHAAAMGGVWQAVVNGFGGIRMIDGNLRMSPRLPENWSSLEFKIIWKEKLLSVKITKNKVLISNLSTNHDLIEIQVFNRLYQLEKQLEVEIL